MQTADYVVGTVVSVYVRTGGCSRATASRALRRSYAWLHRADEILCTWRPDSPLSRLRRDEITLAQAPPEVAEVLWYCAEARRLSDGWFDPWAMPGGVDPAGLVRGWAVAGALDILQRAGIPAALIGAGGIVGAFGAPQAGRRWQVAVPGAGPTGRVAWTVEGPGAVATVTATADDGTPHLDSAGPTAPSADGLDRRRTGPSDEPPTGQRCLTGTVVGPDLAIAEALAVSLLSAGAGGLPLVERAPGYSAMTTDVEGTTATTAWFPGRPGGGDSRRPAAA